MLGWIRSRDAADKADTAIVARSTRTNEAFGGDRQRKLEIREIIAMPLAKKWW